MRFYKILTALHPIAVGQRVLQGLAIFSNGWDHFKLVLGPHVTLRLQVRQLFSNTCLHKKGNTAVREDDLRTESV